MAGAQRLAFLKTGLKNQPGALLKVMQELKAKNISLKIVSGYGSTEGNSDLYVVAKDIKKLKSLLTASGLSAEEGTGFFLKGTDKAGAVLKNLEALANANINLKSIGAVAVGGKFGAFLIIDSVDIDRAAQALGAR
jgi:prephenate dehydratase